MPQSTLSRRVNFLFDWDARDGLDLQGRLVARTGQVGTFTRGGTANAATSIDKNGLVITPGYQTPRFGYDTAAGNFGLRLEGQRADIAQGSSDFSITTYWANAGGMTLAAATSCIAGQVATKHTDAAGGNSRSNASLGVFVNGQPDCVWAIVENVDQTAGNGVNVNIFDNTAGAYLITVAYIFSNDAVSLSAGAGTYGRILLGNGRVLVWAVGTGTAAGTGAAGNNRRAIIRPVSQAGKSTILHHAQFEANAKFPSMPIVTVAAAVTRSPDSLAFSLNAAAQACTFYVKFIEQGTSLGGANANVFSFGDASSGIRIQVYSTGNGKYRVFSNTNESGDDPTTTTIGDVVEIRVVLAATGIPTLYITKNGGAESAGVSSGSSTLPAAWNAQTFYLNSVASSNVGFGLFQAARVAAGAQSLATMQAA